MTRAQQLAQDLEWFQNMREDNRRLQILRANWLRANYPHLKHNIGDLHKLLEEGTHGNQSE